MCLVGTSTCLSRQAWLLGSAANSQVNSHTGKVGEQTPRNSAQLLKLRTCTLLRGAMHNVAGKCTGYQGGPGQHS